MDKKILIVSNDFVSGLEINIIDNGKASSKRIHNSEAEVIQEIINEQPSQVGFIGTPLVLDNILAHCEENDIEIINLR